VNSLKRHFWHYWQINFYFTPIGVLPSLLLPLYL
jgi:hypothetical protein